MGMVVQALVAVDELDAAERICDAAMTAARRRGVLLGYTLASYHRAIARHHMGALVGALGDLDQALTATQEGWSGGAWVYAQQVHTLLERGETLAARDAIAHAYAEAGSMGYAVVAFARARLALAERDAALARLTALDAGRQLSEDFGIDHPGFIPWRDVAALATQALGDRDEAARLAREALDRARWCGVPRVISRSLRTASAVADGQLRVDYLTEARSLIEGSPSLLERAHCLVELGAALRMSGQPTAAQPPLREGLQLADAIGAVPLADRAGAELRVTGVRPRRAAYTGVDALTPAERRVAELAATGLTNAQIAQDLFVTMKTVQTHLAHTYRKLGIESRRDLAGAFGAHRAGTRG
jgi:DNA-binding CsgD family transcriptional regulator